MPLSTRPGLLTTAAALFASAMSVDSLATEPANLDFEDGVVGEVPTGWHSPQVNDMSGYTVGLDDQAAKTGKHSVMIGKVGEPSTDAGTPPPGGGFGNVMQRIDAAPYRGKRVRFGGWARTDISRLSLPGLPRAQAQAWFRVDRAGGTMGFFDNMDDRPIRAKDWQQFEIAGDIAADAEHINFGLLLTGRGKAWLDGVSIEVVGVGGEGNQPSLELDDRGLANLVALTRLLGYVRYFHPTQAVADTDWNLFAVQAVRQVEAAATPDELARDLQAAFQDVAPTVRLAPTGSSFDNPPEVPLADRSQDKTKVRYWEHKGVGLGDHPSIRAALGPPLYSSKLHTSRKAPVSPGVPIEADLGGGVSALVPTAILVSRQASFEGTPAKAPAIDGVPDHWQPSGDDRSSRLAAVALAWTVFQHFYPYFDVVDVDWNATLRRSLTAAAVDAGGSEFARTLRRLVADLRDGHGRVSYPGRPSLLPALMCDWIGETLVVTAVGPDLDERLRPGHVVTEIDGRRVHEILASLTETISAATLWHLRRAALWELSAGPPGSTVTIKTRSPSGEETSFALARETPPVGDGAMSEPRPDQGAELDDGVIYVDLDRIAHVREFNKLLPTLAEANGIVFDLRGYPSFRFTPVIAHLIDETVTSAQWHVPLVYRPDRRDMQFNFSNWSVRPKAPRLTKNVAFVTDGRAISAAETLLGIIEHYKLAEIVGGPTAGTNGNINPFVLLGGYHVSWTGMRVLKHDGSQHHGVGIQPTVPVSRTIAGIAAGRDELLERAVAVVTGR